MAGVGRPAPNRRPDRRWSPSRLDSAEGVPLLLFGRGRNSPASQPVTEIPVESIALNPHQPRESFDERRLAELAASIREHGIIQPLVVRQVGQRGKVAVDRLVRGGACLQRDERRRDREDRRDP
ncbi:MAG: ParB N-terminal domain-containing protein, partial [Firmicutes bacterium]|nr:ParB N-terminal domain-containing protein [Bacillota bacterium]